MFLKKYPAKNYWQAALVLALLGLYAYFLFYHLGVRAYIDWDESIYAQVAKEALLNRQPLSFTFFGQPWFEKPPLMFWLIMLGYKIFGINELGGRFFVALLALATIVLTYFFVKKLSRSFLAAFLALASYAICFHFFFHSYFLEFDIPVTFFVLLSLFGFILAEENPKYFYLFFSALGLGLLTKSVIGLLPLPIIFLYLLARRNFKILKNKHFAYGLLLLATIVVPWHLWETLRFGKNFWNSYFFYHVIDRYATPLENNGGPWNFYFQVLVQNGAFALLTAVSTLYFALKSIKNKNYLLPLLGFVFIYIFFSAAKTKGVGYIVVMYPYLMAMFGMTLNDLLAKTNYQSLKITAIAILLLVFLGLGWQEQNFKILKLEKDEYYNENRDIAKFILQNYPRKPVYGASWVEANLAFSYYMGAYIGGLPPGHAAPPANYSLTSRYRVFHKMERSVYNFPTFLYIAP